MEKDMYKYYEDNLFLPIVPKVYKYKVTLGESCPWGIEKSEPCFSNQTAKKELKQPKRCPYLSFANVSLSHGNLMIPFHKV